MRTPAPVLLPINQGDNCRCDMYVSAPVEHEEGLSTAVVQQLLGQCQRASSAHGFLLLAAHNLDTQLGLPLCRYKCMSGSSHCQQHQLG